MRNKILMGLVIVLSIAGLGIAADRASATDGSQDCANPTMTVRKIVYQYAKYTHTKTKSPDIPGYWQKFSPNKGQGPLQSAPAYPDDPRGTWSDKKTNGGPQPDASGVFQNGGGNGSWFYREQPQTFDWSEYGPWKKWTPETHVAWKDFNVEALGSPQFHAQGTYTTGVKWYREWQDRNTGKRRPERATVPNPNYPCETPDPTPSVEPTPEPTVGPTPTPSEPPTMIPPTHVSVPVPPNDDIIKTRFHQKRKEIVRKDYHRDGTVTVTRLKDVVETGF